LPSFETNPYTSNNDITVASGQTVTLADSIYNKVKVEKFGTVIFSSPVVNIRHLDAKEFTVIRFAQCAIVRMKEHMHIKRNSKFNPDELDVTVFAQKHVDIKEGSVVFATIYAKDEHIHAKGKGNNRTAMTGLFIGKKIHKGEYVDWNANKQCGRCLASPELFGRVIASTDVSCDGASNGSLTLDVTGGTPPYDISWNTIPAQSGATASNLAPGSYVATITDWLGATTTVNTDIIVFGYTILAKDEVKLGKHDSVYTGSVGVTSVAGKIEIGEQSGVVDDDAMVIAPVLNIHATSTVTDEEYGVAAAVLSAFEAVPYVSSTDINVPNGATVTLTPVDTLKRKIVVGENATLIISAGVLNLTDRLELKKNATVRFTQACSKVRIKVDLKTDDNATINSEGKQVTFHVGANVEFKKGSKVSATIYAPNGTIKTEHAAAAAPTIMTGKFIGKKVEGGDYTYWHQRTLCPCISTSGGPVFLANTPGTNNDASGALDKSVSSSIKVNAYPNPFRDQVTISFTSPVADKVRLVVLNPVGSEVEELYDGPVNAEQEYQFRFNAGSTNSSGIYLYRIQTGGGNTVVNKIILTK
jgi:hypothetical protein